MMKVTKNTILATPYGIYESASLGPIGNQSNDDWYATKRSPTESLITLELQPCLLSSLAYIWIGATRVGLDLTEAANLYSDLMEQFKITVEKNPLKIKIALNQVPVISEQFDNTVSPHWLMAKAAGESASGGNNPLNQGGITGAFSELIGQGNFESLAKSISNFLPLPQNTADILGAKISGAQVNVPNVWNSSSKNIQYDFEIKLTNPNVNSDEGFKNNIYMPLMLLLALTLPRRANRTDKSNLDSELTQFSPFYIRAAVPGYFRIRAGIIKGLSIIKGGMEKSFGRYDNNGRFLIRPNIVDIRLSILDLMPSLVGSSESKFGIGGSLRDYADDMLGDDLGALEDKQTYKDKNDIQKEITAELAKKPKNGSGNGGATTRGSL